MPEKIIYLITGLSASGKTYYAKKFSRRTGLELFDEERLQGCTDYTFLKENITSPSFIISSSRYIVPEMRQGLLDSLSGYSIHLTIFEPDRINCMKNHVLRFLKGNKKDAVLGILYRPYDRVSFISGFAETVVIPVNNNLENYLSDVKYLLEKDADPKIMYLLALGLEEHHQGRLAEALNFYHEGWNSLKHSRSNNVYTFSIALSTQLGRAYISLGDYRTGFYYLTEAYKVDTRACVTYGVVAAHLLNVSLLTGELKPLLKLLKSGPDKNNELVKPLEYLDSMVAGDNNYKKKVLNLLHFLRTLHHTWYEAELAVIDNKIAELSASL